MSYRERPDARRAPANEPDWLTLGQAAKFLGVAQSTIRKWSDQGRVPAFYTPGGHRRYRRADLEAFLERSGPGAREQAGPRILIVDDDAGTRAFVRASLELEGFEVDEAESAKVGLAALEQETPDLILLDVMMPQMDGWEMLRREQADLPRSEPRSVGDRAPGRVARPDLRGALDRRIVGRRLARDRVRAGRP